MSAELVVIGVFAFMFMCGGIALLVGAWKMYQEGVQLHSEAQRILSEIESENQDAAFIKEQSRSVSNELFQLSEKALEAALSRDAYLTTRSDSILEELRDVKRQIGASSKSEAYHSSSDRPNNGKSSSPATVGTKRARRQAAEVDAPQSAHEEPYSDVEETALRSLYRIGQLRKDDAIPLDQIHVVASRSPAHEEKLTIEEVSQALEKLTRRDLVERIDKVSSEEPCYRVTERGRKAGEELD